MEIQNEIVMQSILRHPNIALLMGCCPPIPNIVIVYELVDNNLFNVLHMKRNIELAMTLRVKIALDCARVYLYMHNLGIVHRDIKSQNVLIDNNHNVKVCDFGLARFIVSPLIFRSNSDMFSRLIWVLELCNLLAHRAIWPLNFSKSANTMRRWMCLHMARSSGRSSKERCPSMDSKWVRSGQKSKEVSSSVSPMATTSACCSLLAIAGTFSPLVDPA